MRCTGFCTANSYDIAGLFQSMGPRGAVQLHREALHFQLREDKRTRGDIFYFSYGAVVFWGFAANEEKEFLHDLKKFERDPALHTEDEFTYIYGDGMKIEDDEICLPNKSSLSKFSISHGIAQSVKLTIFEESIQKTFDNTKRIPVELSERGNISLSRKEISQQMGQIFLERNYVNLHTEMLDTPEFFWEHPELEPFYRRTAHYLDITKRAEALNRRLNVIHELFEILRNELNHQYSSRLEWTIIILIVIEVLLSLVSDIFHLI